jgi:hypothetical protein
MVNVSQYYATHAPPQTPDFSKQERILRKDKVGGFVNKWTEDQGFSFNNITTRKKFGPARKNLERMEVLRALSGLGDSSRRAWLNFIENDEGRNRIKLLTSDGPIRALAGVKDYDYNNMFRILKVMVKTSACETIIDVDFLRFVGKQEMKIRTGMLVGASDFGERGMAILNSKEVRGEIGRGKLEEWDAYSIASLFRGLVASQDVRMIASGFIDNISPLNDKVRMALCEAARGGADVGKITAPGTASVARSMGNAPMPVFLKMLGKITMPSGIRPRT